MTPPEGPGDTAVCVIDCGSNPTRVLIRTASAVLSRTTTITKLSEGAAASGVLSEEAIERVLSVLKEARTACDRFGVTEGVLISTSTVRDAVNADAFLERAAAICGFPAHVISGDQEAAYAFAGATSGFDPANSLVIDIGGSSTELAKENPVAGLDTASLQLGCVRVTESALGTSPVTTERALSATLMIDNAIDEVRQAPHWLATADLGKLHTIIIGGTAETLASMIYAQHTGDPTPKRPILLTGTKIPTSSVHSMCDVVASLSPDDIKALPGMVPGRETTVVAGLFILGALLQRLSIEEITFSASSLIDAAAADLLSTPRP
jgi:exopolyphosphatase/guanosine-5'-triphosphate,3'-diphosphate pyrophosphatase